MRTVIALGGNAIASGNEVTVDRQKASIESVAGPVSTLAKRGHDLLFTHGNGPQIGQLLLRQSAADAPSRPLDVLVAETQAQIGYLLADRLEPALDGRVSTVVSRVRVDPADPEFEDPSKPVGPYYTEAEAAEKDFETGPVWQASGERAYRRLVPSPEPTTALETDAIRALVADGVTVVCGGGGGIPVVRDSADRGVEAVVEKDYTSHLVASAVDADRLVMATDVSHAYRDFGTDDERPIRETEAASMRTAVEEEEFATGSMRPKVEACLRFLEEGGEQAVITTPDAIVAAVDGDAGTRIYP